MYFLNHLFIGRQAYHQTLDPPPRSSRPLHHSVHVRVRLLVVDRLRIPAAVSEGGTRSANSDGEYMRSFTQEIGESLRPKHEL